MYRSITRRLVPTFSALLLVCGSSAANQDFDFSATANAVLAAAGMPDAQPEDFQLASLLEATQVSARLGVFEVSMAKVKLEEDENVERWISIQRALLQSQGQFLAWVAPATGLEMQGVEEDIETIEKFLRRLGTGALQKAVADGAMEFWAAAGAGEEVLAALDRLEMLLAGGEALGIEREEPTLEHIVLTPDRRQFVDLASIAGWMIPGSEGIFWNDRVVEWNNFYINEVSVLCLVNPGETPKDLDTSQPLDSKYKDGLEQQMVQLSANALFDNQFGANIPPSLAQAFAVNLVVDTFGTCSTRVDGDLRERRTEAVEMFVPGGNPDGGTLPAVLADNRWRINQGKDRFLKALVAAQKAGAKEMRGEDGKLRHFELISEGQDQRTVSGPFIGPNSKGGAALLPASFKWDQIEFLRSYRIGFVFWLRDTGLSKGKQSEARFGQFLLALAQDTERRGIATIAKELYERPLSDQELGPRTDLEGAFLAWLRRQ